MTAAIIDCETTGKVEPECIEAAWIWLEFGYPTRRLMGEEGRDIPTRHRFKPSKPIELGALVAHGIMDEELAIYEPSATFRAPECDYWIGANCDYDWTVAGKPEKPKRIDTCSMARRIWPGLDTYSQSGLIYHLDRANARERLKSAHGAAADVLLCKTILDAIITATAVESWADLYELSEEYRIPTEMPFGKHQGQRIEELPPSYTQWLLKLPDLDPYLRKAITQKGQGQQNLF